MNVLSDISTDQEKSEALRTLITKKLEEGNLELPLLPAVADQVLMVCNNPNADSTKLSTLIQQDQALAGQILRIANSPAYLPRSPIASLQQAITWLGLNMLGCLAFSISVQSGVFVTKGYENEIQAQWRHALASGLYGREIARRIRHNAENAFLCGLLHSIGQPVVVHLILQSTQDWQEQLPWSVINELIQEFHVLVGTQLAIAWKLPEPVQEAIRLSSDETYVEAISPTKGAIITCLANHLASYTLGSSSLDEETLRTLPVVQDLNFYPDDMDTLLELGNDIQQSLLAFLI